MAVQIRGRSLKQVGVSLLLFSGALVLVIVANQIRFVELLHPLQELVFSLEDSYQPWLDQYTSQNPLLLLPLAFAGGLIASVSPCVLCLLPVNLSYIGTREITSRRDAFVKAGSFVLGVCTTLSLIGLFSSFAAAVTVQYRGYINLVVGTIILLMGLSLLEIIRLRLPRTPLKLPIAGAYGFGLTFALVASPCASPIMFAVVAAAAATGSQLYSVLIMLSYAIGYTAIIFCASLFTGLAKQARSLLPHSGTIFRIGGIALLLVGGYYMVNGINWLRLTVGR